MATNFTGAIGVCQRSLIPENIIKNKATLGRLYRYDASGSFSFRTGVAVAGLILLSRLRFGTLAALRMFVMIRLALITGFIETLIALIPGATSGAACFVIITSAWHS
jgi:hypothetical protein